VTSSAQTCLGQLSPACVVFLQALLQAHTDRLEQQNQAHVQHLVSEHASEMQSKTNALTVQLQQQVQTEVAKAASRSAGDIAQGQQSLEKAEALLAAEKQKSAALKV